MREVVGEIQRGPEPRLVVAYRSAKEYVLAQGFGPEIEWQDNLALAEPTEEHFLREAAWVILSSGLSYAVVRHRFLCIERSFCHFQSAAQIIGQSEKCRVAALQVFNHAGKIDAIIGIAARISEMGFEKFYSYIRVDPTSRLQDFAYLGPATARHLAKNLGFQVAKPDRHLARIARRAGFSSVDTMCWFISDWVSDPIPVIDLVLWRFATLRRNYLALFPLVD